MILASSLVKYKYLTSYNISEGIEKSNVNVNTHILNMIIYQQQSN